MKVRRNIKIWKKANPEVIKTALHSLKDDTTSNTSNIDSIWNKFRQSLENRGSTHAI